MGSTVRLAVYGAIFAAVFLAFPRRKRNEIPAHLLGNKYQIVPGLLSEKQASELLDLMKSFGAFPSNLADGKIQTTSHEHIGEAQPIGKNGKCNNPYLLPSVDKKSCVLPGRIDVGRHFMVTGGVEGVKEPYDVATSRLQSFGKYNYNASQYPLAVVLFQSPRFQGAVKSVCPADKQVLDPFQFNFIIQVPGQTVAYHLDAPYFWGASRFQFPQWLLVTMVFSNLFQDKFIDQIQVVGYLHRWSPDKIRLGDFVFWMKEGREFQTAPPTPLAGLILDGSKTVHAASIYYPTRDAPKMPKSQDNLLKHLGEDRWAIESSGKILKEYTTDDLRISIVYRARCFTSEEEKLKFNQQLHQEGLRLEDIIETFEKDLVKRGRMHPGQNISRLKMAEILMNEYVKYPLPIDAWIPYNYCLAIKFYPWTRHILKYFC